MKGQMCSMNSPCSSNIGSVLPSLISASTDATSTASVPFNDLAVTCDRQFSSKM
jgi:hypothetical protein